MKKVVFLILTLALVFGLASTALAANDETGTTQITYEVTSSYTITIPASEITVPGTTANVGIAEKSVILPTKKLNVSISGATNYDYTDTTWTTAGFKMKNETGTNVYLAYTVSCTGDDSIDKDETFLTVAASECYAGKSIALTFTPATAQLAGVYKDTVTFAFALAGVSQP